MHETARPRHVADHWRGLCVSWRPERVTLDEWGYPIVDGTPLSPDLVKHARRAAAECPVRALRLRSVS